MRSHTVLSAIAFLALAAAPVASSPAPAETWQPWLGCWQPTGVVASDQTGVICVLPNDAAGGVDIRTIIDGRVVGERTVIADGARHAASFEDCEGWESARWSADGYMVFVESELDCDNGLRRFSSGIIAMSGADEWLDVQSVLVGGARDIAVRRLHPVAAPDIVAGTVATGSLGVQTARIAASQPLTIEAVMDASAAVDREILETLMIERNATFDLDSDALVRLADAGVEPRLIDLMVALSYPDDFNINREARAANPATSRDAFTGIEDRRYGFGYGYDPFYYGGRYSYYDPFYYSPFGFGNSFYGGGGYGWNSRGSVIIVRQPNYDGFSSRSSGRFVRGSGYVGSGSSSGSAVRSGSSSGSSSSASSSSKSGSGAGKSTSTGSSSSGSTGRTAKKKGGG